MFNLKNVASAIAMGLIVHYAVQYITKPKTKNNDNLKGVDE